MNINHDLITWPADMEEPTDFDAVCYITAHRKNLVSDVTKQEQIMADTLQQRRLILSVVDHTARPMQPVAWHMCEPDENSAHRVVQ